MFTQRTTAHPPRRTDPCTTMFFFRNKHIMIDLGTGNNNKINVSWLGAGVLLVSGLRLLSSLSDSRFMLTRVHVQWPMEDEQEVIDIIEVCLCCAC